MKGECKVSEADFKQVVCCGGDQIDIEDYIYCFV